MNKLLSYRLKNKTEEDFYDPAYVKELFNEMSSSYEAVNYITSFGFSLRWRKQFIKTLAGNTGNIRVGDFMTGLGENWDYIQQHWSNSEIDAIDFSDGMLRIASKKNQVNFRNSIRIINADVLDLPFSDNQFDIIVCAFGLKTLDQNQIKILAQEICRLLKPGGRYSFIEVSVPENRFLKMLYLFYLEKIIPVIGQLLRGKPRQYKMLGYYTRKFKNAEQAMTAFKLAGLNPVYRKYFNGCATGFFGQKGNDYSRSRN